MINKSKSKFATPQSFHDNSLISIYASITKAFGTKCDTSSIEELDTYINQNIKGNIEKAIIYIPSAISATLTQAFSDVFQPVRDIASIEVAALSEYPPTDINCCSAMLTGQPYKKQRNGTPLQPIFSKLGKNCAIIASKKSIISTLFINSQVKVYQEDYDGEIVAKAVQLLKDNSHDILIIINQEYKDMMRISHPYSKKALTAMNTHIAAFELLANAAEVYLQDYNILVGFAPCYGAHRSLLGLGTTGKYIPQDMNVLQYYGVFPNMR